eukprot:1329009-Amorphochlora_amoeboformis.AAC.1
MQIRNLTIQQCEIRPRERKRCWDARCRDLKVSEERTKRASEGGRERRDMRRERGGAKGRSREIVVNRVRLHLSPHVDLPNCIR